MASRQHLESPYLLRALAYPWPEGARVDTTRTEVYGIPLNIMTVFTFPGHEPDLMDQVRAMASAYFGTWQPIGVGA